MPDYVRQANKPHDYVIEIKELIRKKQFPSLTLTRSTTQVAISALFAYLAYTACPEDIIESYWIVRFIVVAIITPLAAAYGVYMVANIGEQECGFKVPAIGSFLGVFVYWDEPSQIIYSSLISSTFLHYHGARWKPLFYRVSFFLPVSMYCIGFLYFSVFFLLSSDYFSSYLSSPISYLSFFFVLYLIHYLRVNSSVMIFFSFFPNFVCQFFFLFLPSFFLFILLFQKTFLLMFFFHLLQFSIDFLLLFFFSFHPFLQFFIFSFSNFTLAMFLLSSIFFLSPFSLFSILFKDFSFFFYFSLILFLSLFLLCTFTISLLHILNIISKFAFPFYCSIHYFFSFFFFFLTFKPFLFSFIFSHQFPSFLISPILSSII
ncbi:unnamed protein product [Acanthosepion pharaonis]|uniref:Uncharacterized protein n=1 Tax=Acanthosepion pharaonis TaxID=158019 RepID=A0A812DYN6_ACAPH|nr:unnamed protein product [Sepia pharaonis]